VEADLVGGADRLAAPDAAAGHPHGEAVGVVVAAVALLGHGRTAELAAPEGRLPCGSRARRARKQVEGGEARTGRDRMRRFPALSD